MAGKVVVLGAGLAGLSTAYFLRQNGWESVRVYEKEAYAGGHITSFQIGDFVFDQGPHTSFTKDEYVKAFLSDSADVTLVERAARISNYYQGNWYRHPVQCNLNGLPGELVERCILDIIEAAQAQADTPPADYGEWCYRGLGKAFSDEFTFRYTRKYWTVEARQMTTDWVGDRVYRPQIADVIHGAVAPDTEERPHHYLTHFRYPESGGFVRFFKRLSEGAPVVYGHRVTEVDLRSRRICFAGGAEAEFETLVSTLPLPDLIQFMPDAPAKVREAAGLLRCSSVVLVSLGIDRPDISPYHWFYIYDEDIPFARAHLPGNLAPANVPPGCSSIQCEIYFSPYRPLWASVDELTEQTITSLQRMGVLRPEDHILAQDTRVVRYANVIFDHNREPALETIQSYLRGQGVYTCGRYGDWAYLWTDDVILGGKRVAEEIVRGGK